MKYHFGKKDKDEQLVQSTEHIKKLVNVYVNILSKYVNLEPYLDQLDFYLLERKCGYIKTKDNSKSVKDGIHISVPGFLFDNVILHKVRQEVIEDPEFVELFEDIGQENDIYEFLDESVISKNAWFMYGSGKAFTDPYLQLKYINTKLLSHQSLKRPLNKHKIKYSSMKTEEAKKLLR